MTVKLTITIKINTCILSHSLITKEASDVTYPYLFSYRMDITLMMSISICHGLKNSLTEASPAKAKNKLFTYFDQETKVTWSLTQGGTLALVQVPILSKKRHKHDLQVLRLVLTGALYVKWCTRVNHKLFRYGILQIKRVTSIVVSASSLRNCESGLSWRE